MKYYKGFNKDMTCRGFQYEEGKEYTHEGAVSVCNSGFHACEDPLDCFGYYAPGESVFHEVELDGVVKEKNSEDTKVAAKTIKVGAEISLPLIAKAHVEYVLSKVDRTRGKHEDNGIATTTGNRSAATNTGNRSAATVEGKGSVAIVTGRHSKAKACKGSAIVVCERGEWDGETFPLRAIKAAIVDGVVLKADTWYTLENGEFVEVE